MKTNSILFCLCLILTALALTAANQITKTNTSTDIIIETITNDKSHDDVRNSQTEFTRRNGSIISIVKKSVTKTGITNITASFLVDNSIVLTTVDLNGDGKPEKFFIESPITHNVEGFTNVSTSNPRPLATSELQKFKEDIKPFQ